MKAELDTDVIGAYAKSVRQEYEKSLKQLVDIPSVSMDPEKKGDIRKCAEAAQELLRTWRRHGHDIGFGVGVSQGYATLGQIGFAERMDYTAIGTVTNLAARLCGEAKDGQILISRRVATAVEDSARLEEIGDLALKGLSQAVAVYNVSQ